MGGMGSLYVGVSGLQTSQNALNTTAHNLTNVGTPGFVRQQVVQADTLYNTIKYGAVSMQQVGIGATIAQVRQVRDEFLDISYRLEAGRQSFYDIGYQSYYQIETLLGTLDGAQFGDSLESLRVAVGEVSKDPTDPASIALLKQNAVKFIDDAKDVYSKLEEYQNNLNAQVVSTVDRINTLASNINELNKQIVMVEAGKIENANDLRDARNSALDELAGLIKISYSEDSNGCVSVSAEEVPLVGEGYLYSMGTKVDKETGLLTPVWKQYDNSPVFNISSSTISTDNNSDVGKLKALILHRGDRAADYTDIPVESKYKDADGKWLAGNWTIDGKVYTDGKKAYEAATVSYNDNISACSLMNTMAEFDQLINGIVTAINDALCPNTQMAVDGTEGYIWRDENGVALTPGNYTVLDLENCTMNEDGVVGTELFSRQGIERYTKYTYTDADGEHTCYVYNEPDESIKRTLYSVKNLEVNQAFEDNPKLFPGYNQNGEVAYPLGEKLAKLFSQDFASLNPNATSKANFENYFTKMKDEIAIYGNIYGKISETQQDAVNSIDDDRQMVMGVSSDEELSNMIKFQNAYNASSRYINVVDEMLEHLITQLGS